MCVPPLHIKRSLSVCPSARRTFIEGASHEIQFAKQWLHILPTYLSRLLCARLMRVYIKMLFMCTSLINFLVRAKKKKKSQTEKASDMRFEKLDQNIFISRAFLSISPSPATMLCAWDKQKSVRTLTTKASSMVWKQKFPIDNISACYFSLTLGGSSLSRSCCLLAS